MNRISDIRIMDTYGRLTDKEIQSHTQQFGIYNPQFKIFRILLIIRF